MNDSEAIGYLMQYLESLNVSCLAKCVLDIDHLNATLVIDDPAQVPWEAVKCVNRLIDKQTGKISWELPDGLNYTNHVACDIASYCSTKTVVRAASEKRLREMRENEQAVFVGLMEKERVPQPTVDALTIFYKYFSYAATFLVLLPEDVFRRLLNRLRVDINRETFMEVRSVIFSVLQNE